MEILALVGAALQIFILLFKEYFASRERARAAQEKFELDQDTLKKLIQSAVTQYNSTNAKQSQQAGSIWDMADQAADLKVEPVNLTITIKNTSHE